MKRFKNLVILTGAGISAESGIRTFRAADGLWEEHRIEDVASPSGFARNPALVQRFYDERRRQLGSSAVAPNAAHFALARLESEWEGSFTLITQNVDNLHERAGSQALLHMHGSLLSMFCTSCRERVSWSDDFSSEHVCSGCSARGTLRPDIVWFGEMPYYMDTIEAVLGEADLFISIGTSGNVYPAAGFASAAYRAHRIEVNLGATEISSRFHEHLVGAASVVVPELVSRLLAE